MGLLTVDARTVVLVIWMGNLIAVSLLAIYSYSQRPVSPVLTYFFLSRLAQTFALMLFWLRGFIPEIFSMVLANTFLYAGWSLEALSLVSIRQRHKLLEIVYIVIALLSLPVNFAIYQVETANIRIVIASLFAIPIFTPPALKLFLEKNGSILQRVVGFLYLLLLTGWFVRIVVALVNHSYSVMTPDATQSNIYLLLFWLMMFGSVGYLLLFKERTDQELLLAATTDPVTNISNRRTFFKNIEKPVYFAIRNRQPVGLLTIDIDNFKKINDTFGHPQGDQTLKDFANSVQQFTRPYDLFGRLGGDEFIMFLPKTSSDEALSIATRIQKMAEEKCLGEETPVKYTVSIGICTFIPEQMDDLNDLIRTSDQALLQAKKAGRNQVFQLDYKRREKPIDKATA